MHQKLELVGLETVLWPEPKLGRPSPTPHWKVTYALPDLYGSQAMTIVYHFPKDQLPEQHIVTITRNWAHRLCSEVAGDTKGWHLNDKQTEALLFSQTEAQPQEIDNE